MGVLDNLTAKALEAELSGWRAPATAVAAPPIEQPAPKPKQPAKPKTKPKPVQTPGSFSDLVKIQDENLPDTLTSVDDNSVVTPIDEFRDTTNKHIEDTFSNAGKWLSKPTKQVDPIEIRGETRLDGSQAVRRGVSDPLGLEIQDRIGQNEPDIYDLQKLKKDYPSMSAEEKADIVNKLYRNGQVLPDDSDPVYHLTGTPWSDIKNTIGDIIDFGKTGKSDSIELTDKPVSKSPVNPMSYINKGMDFVNNINSRVQNSRRDMANDPRDTSDDPTYELVFDNDMKNPETGKNWAQSDLSWVYKLPNGQEASSKDMLEPEILPDNTVVLGNGVKLTVDQYNSIDTSKENQIKQVLPDGTTVAYADGTRADELPKFGTRQIDNRGFLGLAKPHAPWEDYVGRVPTDKGWRGPQAIDEALPWLFDGQASSIPYMIPGPYGKLYSAATAASRAFPALQGYDVDTYEPAGTGLKNLLAEGSYEKKDMTNQQKGVGFGVPFLDAAVERAGGESIGISPKNLDKIPGIKKLPEVAKPIARALISGIGEGSEEVVSTLGQWLGADNPEQWGKDSYYNNETGETVYLDTPWGDRVRNGAGDMLENFLGGFALGTPFGAWSEKGNFKNAVQNKTNPSSTPRPTESNYANDKDYKGISIFDNAMERDMQDTDRSEPKPKGKNLVELEYLNKYESLPPELDATEAKGYSSFSEELRQRQKESGK